MKIHMLLYLFLFISTVLFAQNSISPDEYFQGKYKIDRPVNIQWNGGKDEYCYIKNDILWFGNSKSSKQKEKLNLQSLVKLSGVDFESFPHYTFLGSDTIRLTHNNKKRIIVLDLKKKSKILDLNLDENADSINISKQNTIAYTIKNNLYIVNHNKEVKQVTDNPEGIVSGVNVARSEFGLRQATVWSPLGDLLAFYEKDERHIANFPLVDYSGVSVQVQNLKYPFAGGENQKYKIGVYNLNDNSKTYLNIEQTDGYLTNMTWDPRGETIYVVILSRDQKKLQVKQYDAITGEYIRTIFSETHDKYIEPEEQLLFLKSKLVEFLWLSESSGYKHLYHYTIDGEILNPLTEGDWEIAKIIGFDSKDENIYFLGTTEEAPYERHIYVANIISLKVTKLSKKPGYHDCILNKETGNIVDVYSSMETAFVASVLDSKGTILQEIANVKSPYEGYDIPTVSLESIKASDQETNLWMKIIKPSYFDETKKYPVIFNVYGGPHVQMVKNIWRGYESQLPYFLAEQGFIVVVVDGRGSANRGLKFENATYKNLGIIEAQDQKKALDYIKTKKWTYNDKIGIYGASFGGFMTLKMLLTYPDDFKAGVAVYPVTNWSNYELMYTERYMSTPTENPEGYKAANMIEQVENLKARLLLIEGGLDHITLPIHSFQFLNACIEKDIPTDFFIYPMSDHGPTTLNSLKHYYQKVITYFTDYLKQ